MGWRARGGAADAAETATHISTAVEGGKLASVLSAFALVFSGYSLWETSLKQSDLRLFVPPVIHYASPYQNSNFEVLAIPLTLANEGAQTGTVLSINLEVTDPKTQQTKRFYSADFGRWTMERTRANSYEPFAPISLDGRARRTETVLFYTRGEAEKPDQLIREPGTYQFKLTLDEAAGTDWFGRPQKTAPASVSFERELKYYDARAFNTGTLPLYAKDWRSATNAGE